MVVLQDNNIVGFFLMYLNFDSRRGGKTPGPDPVGKFIINPIAKSGFPKVQEFRCVFQCPPYLPTL
jgi:hypothetical protein